ncbi:MAG: hypothetical protein IT454_11760 [Planctomycetes bacterium]|nr:hypothetical protein [Planctomycetota bacterium]
MTTARLVREEAPVAAPPVTCRLLCERVQIGSGESFLIALRVDVPPSARVSWENPGAAGRALHAELSAPKGFQVSPALFPAPSVFTDEAGERSFGYETRTMLFFRVEAPAELAQGTRVEFKARLDWSTVGAQASAGQAEERLELATYPARDTGPREGSSEIAHFAARLPQPFAELQGAAHEWSRTWEDTGEGAGFRLDVLVVDASELDFYPLAANGLDWAGSSTQARGKNRELQLDFVSDPSVEATREARGVVRTVRNGVEQFWLLRTSCALPSVERAPAPKKPLKKQRDPRPRETGTDRGTERRN